MTCGSSWQEASPIAIPDGKVHYDIPFTGDTEFHRLQRPATP